MRLDFETFTNQGPADTKEGTGGGPNPFVLSTCDDTFTVTTSTGGTTYPVICGDNTGQHSKSKIAIKTILSLS